MTPKELKVLFVCAEVSPFSSVGGLSQVAYFLTKALKKSGVDVRIFTPKYPISGDKHFSTKTVLPRLSVPTSEQNPGPHTPASIDCSVEVYQPHKDDVPIYLLTNEEYYDKRANVYGYSDDHIRFGLLSRAALEFMKTGVFVPDIVHANDWHTGYLIDWLHREKGLEKVASLLSVHNIYQGVFDFARASEMDYDDGKSPLESFYSDRFFKQNALKRGIMYADAVNTVSESYVRELMTDEYGGGLQNLFKELRGKLYGVLNGLDINDFNPANDKIIKTNFSKSDLRGRAENKADLQKAFGLDQNPNAPLIGFVGRLDYQKGLDLIKTELEFILDEFPAQFVIVGPAGSNEVDYFKAMEEKFPGRVGSHLMFDPILPRKVFAGADMILMPSKYEPGGIVAIEALRYGCIPIVRATGGLADSVINYDPDTNTGYGFTFKQFRPESFLTAVVRAIEVYRNKTEWTKLIKRGMEQDFSWAKTAVKYIDLYTRALDFRKEALDPNPSRAFRPMYS